MPGLPQMVEGLLEFEVGFPGAAVEGVEVSAGLLEHLERGRQLAERGHRLVADPAGHRMDRRASGMTGGAEAGEQVVVHAIDVPRDGCAHTVDSWSDELTRAPQRC